VYDSTNNRMIVFGGGLGFTTPCANDVWVLTNANGNGGVPTWSQLAPTGTLPSPRIMHSAVYDPNTNSMIVYGGQNCSSTTFSDVWVLSHANGLGGTPAWTQLSPSGGGPGARALGPSAIYDSANNKLVVFGGSSGGTVMNDVWVLSNANGTGGTPSWAQLSISGSAPSARAGNTAIFDPGSDRMNIFGGIDGANTLLGDSWVLLNANGLGGSPSWMQLGPFTIFPGNRAYHSAVYNGGTNKMTIFGGEPDFTIITNDAWILPRGNGK
jgi:hypothetical protein